ncbi:MAG: 30S ribosomal protein S20 [Candidatus Margulisbacteria bacterium]|nr:30S ribosomal protein S20 [Candidatus Margulisiibacteriota bacterium]
MAQRSKSGKKRVRSSAKRKARNLQTKEAIKKAVKAADRAIQAKSAEAAGLVKKAVSVIDKAAERGIIHKNKASRKKSRLALRLKKAG